MNKDELLQQINTDRRQLERYLFYFEKDDNGEFVPSKRIKFSHEEILQPGAVADLSVNDIVTLLSGWESNLWSGTTTSGLGRNSSSSLQT